MNGVEAEGLRILNEAITGKRTVQPWSCWVTYRLGCNAGEVVDGVYPTELEALRRLNNDYYLRAKRVFAGEVREQLQ